MAKILVAKEMRKSVFNSDLDTIILEARQCANRPALVNLDNLPVTKAIYGYMWMLGIPDLTERNHLGVTKLIRQFEILAGSVLRQVDENGTEHPRFITVIDIRRSIGMRCSTSGHSDKMLKNRFWEIGEQIAGISLGEELSRLAAEERQREEALKSAINARKAEPTQDTPQGVFVAPEGAQSEKTGTQ